MKKFLKYFFSLLFILILSFLLWKYQTKILPESFFSAEKIEKDSQEPNSPTSSQGVIRRFSFKNRLEEAQNLMNNGYYSAATRELAQAIKMQADNKDSYLLLGEIYLRTQDFIKLNTLINTIQNKFSDNSEGQLLQIRSLIAQENFTVALSILENQGNTISNEMKFYKALLFSYQNKYEEAYQILKNILSKENKDTVRENIRNKAEAIKSVYDEFENFSDGEPAYLFTLTAKKLLDYDEYVFAKNFASLAIKESVKYVDAWVVRGMALFKMEKFSEALLDLRQAYELDPVRNETHYFLALVLDKLNKQQEAVIFFEKALEGNFPFETEIKWKLIDIFIAQKKYEQAKELFRSVINDDTSPQKYVPVIHTLVDILKSPELAEEITNKIMLENEDSILAVNLHAWALIANKKFVEAKLLLDKAITMREDYARTYLNYGLLLEVQDQKFEAVKMYKKCFELGKGQAFNSVINLAVKKYNTLIEELGLTADGEVREEDKQ